MFSEAPRPSETRQSQGLITAFACEFVDKVLGSWYRVTSSVPVQTKKLVFLTLAKSIC